ncbi:hydroxyacylglutathione hydrolase [Agrilutibacter solisilvae]|uniref:Hydroxyacylglutathione hydrolase n=1 Tax=Agrilutibacter solisilvae TaxID=2763317 RepID=A0A974XYS7_9GAMM|nr:hydroxyacylglutathione hydrolase [Lysobacter solisilvae]QSX78276.1 hydroxyacylglutathione hydrolase [Lysobacter solisilvae]
MDLRALPALGDNYIWALVDAQGRVLVVDPGEPDPVLALLEGEGLSLAGILLTHHHHDHIGGAAALRQRWPELPVFGPADERITVGHASMAEGDRVRIADWSFDVLEIPGHTLTHIAFAGEGVVFCGDTLFSLGCGRLFEGTPTQMLASLDKLVALPGSSRVCCGHEYTINNGQFARVVEPGNPALARRIQEAQAMRDRGNPTVPSSLAEELQTNPFLRVDAPGVLASLSAHLGRPPIDRVDAFAQLRLWKDGFVA